MIGHQHLSWSGPPRQMTTVTWDYPSGHSVKMLAVLTTLVRPSWPAYHALQCPRHVSVKTTLDST